MSTVAELVEQFAANVVRQTEAIERGDAVASNRFADEYIGAWRRLREIGDAGREALAELLSHHEVDVRTAAATFLLRYRTAEAKQVLEEAAEGQGLVAFEAAQALKRWEEGDWHLDPD